METKDKTNKPPKYWMSGVPEKDNFEDKITDTFIDAQTVHGSSWAMMTPASYKLHGKGLDQGLGQMYKKQANGKWLKVEPKLEEKPEKDFIKEHIIIATIPKYDMSIFKGVDHKYENLYVQNKAIEELLDKKVKHQLIKSAGLNLVEITENNLTAEETIFLDKYAGYGGLEKFGAKGVGLFYEYFTPDEIVKLMWGLAYKYGFPYAGRMLEPSCGTGRFFKYSEKSFAMTGFEINIHSALVCKILYPTSYVYHNYFEQVFLKNNMSIKNKISELQKHDLVIGNPPYGDISTGASKWFAMGEDKYSKATNYIDYFIFRGLDLLVHGGLLIYIVGAEKHAGGSLFLEKGNNKTKEMISEKAELIDAYKLPAKLFETTGVSTEVIVMRKI